MNSEMDWLLHMKTMSGFIPVSKEPKYKATVIAKLED